MVSKATPTKGEERQGVRGVGVTATKSGTQSLAPGEQLGSKAVEGHWGRGAKMPTVRGPCLRGIETKT